MAKINGKTASKIIRNSNTGKRKFQSVSRTGSYLKGKAFLRAGDAPPTFARQVFNGTKSLANKTYQGMKTEGIAKTAFRGAVTGAVANGSLAAMRGDDVWDGATRGAMFGATTNLAISAKRSSGITSQTFKNTNWNKTGKEVGAGVRSTMHNVAESARNIKQNGLYKKGR